MCTCSGSHPGDAKAWIQQALPWIATLVTWYVLPSSYWTERSSAVTVSSRTSDHGSSRMTSPPSASPCSPHPFDVTMASACFRGSQVTAEQLSAIPHAAGPSNAAPPALFLAACPLPACPLPACADLGTALVAPASSSCRHASGRPSIATHLSQHCACIMSGRLAL